MFVVRGEGGDIPTRGNPYTDVKETISMIFEKIKPIIVLNKDY